MPDPQSDPRATLRQAIAERAKAKEAVTRATKAEAGGRRLRDGAEAQLQSFDSVEGDIVQHHAAKFRKAATGGSAPDTRLPDELTARRSARDDARDMLAAAKAAFDSLAGELKAAEAELGRAERHVADAAIEILLAEATAAMPSLTQVWRDLWRTIDSWGALSSIARLPAGMTRELQFFAGNDHRQFPGNSNVGKARAVAHWRSRLEALRADADAAVSAPTADDDAAGHYERVA